ncbi:MAG: hypothetical protein PF569_00330 [Candidatus Woesearchaeota archaeon]|jgi:hypothetical protein|nr:hypothetical protein [Candidatus Woesearchaeota archaeon]
MDISEITFKICQEGNTNGSTEKTEVLDIIVEASLFIDKKDEYFFTLKTETGWSIENKEEMGKLLDNCKKSVDIFIENIKGEK